MCVCVYIYISFGQFFLMYKLFSLFLIKRAAAREGGAFNFCCISTFTSIQLSCFNQDKFFSKLNLRSGAMKALACGNICGFQVDGFLRCVCL